MAAGDQPELDNRLFARFYRFNRRTAERRGELDHRRRLLAGMSGRVVELGAGEGVNFDLYPPEVDELVAIEPERNMRPRAEEAAAKAAVRVRVIAAFADQLPLEDESVDAAVASLVLCSVPDPDVALAELRRVVRPGGELRFYEHVHAQHQPLRGFLEAAYKSGIWPRIAGGCNPTRDTEQAIERAGFAIERCDCFAFSPSVLSPKLPFRLGVARRSP